MFRQLVFVTLCLELTSAASTLSVITSQRAEPRTGFTGPISHSSSASAVAASTVGNDQDLTGSKLVESTGGAGYNGGYPVNQQNAFIPAAINSYPYGSSPGVGSGGNNQIFGVSSNGDLTLSAYFGPVFWGFVSGIAISIVLIILINLFGGFEFVGTAIRGIGESDKKKSGIKSRSMDLDQIASIVYAAMDKYNKWNISPKDNQF